MPLHEIIVIYIWPATVIVGVIATLVFVLTISLRFFSDRRNNINKKRKMEMGGVLLTHIYNPLHNLRAVLIKKKKDIDLLAELAPELLHTLKGSSYEDLLNSLKDVGLYDWLKVSFNSKDNVRRLSAAFLAAHWPEEEIKNELVLLLKDEQAPVRHAALESLAYTQDIKLFPVIVNELKTNQLFSYPLICDVFQKFDSSIAPELVNITQDKDSSLNIRMAALMALGEMGDIENINKAAIPLCSSEQDIIRALAFRVIAKSGKSVSDDLLEKGARDAYWQARLYVADCAANTLPVPLNILNYLLKDKNWLVGLQAAKVLFSTGDAGKKLLYIISKHKDTISGQRADMILAEEGEVNGMV